MDQNQLGAAEEAPQDPKQEEAPSTMALAPASYHELEAYGRMFAASGFYKGIRKASQAMAKLEYGRELGVGRAAAMSDIHLVDGKPVLSGTLLAALVRRSERYDYRIVVHTDERCEIEFLRLRNDEWVTEGTSAFDAKDMQKGGLAGKDNWKKFPRNMMFARAMSNGVKWFAPDIFAGMSVYSEGDDMEAPPVDASFDPARDVIDVEVMDAQHEEAPTAAVTPAMLAEIRQLAPKAAKTVEDICQSWGVETLEDLSFPRVTATIDKLRALGAPPGVDPETGEIAPSDSAPSGEEPKPEAALPEAEVASELQVETIRMLIADLGMEEAGLVKTEKLWTLEEITPTHALSVIRRLELLRTKRAPARAAK